MVGCSGPETCLGVISPVPETEVRKGLTLINVDQSRLPSNSVSLSSLRLQDVQFAYGLGRFLHTDRLTDASVSGCVRTVWLSGCLPRRSNQIVCMTAGSSGKGKTGTHSAIATTYHWASHFLSESQVSHLQEAR